MRPPPTNVLGTVVTSFTWVNFAGLSGANHSLACLISSSDMTFEIVFMRLTSSRTPLLKSIIVRRKYSAGKPARSEDSGWPSPDIRWQAPQARAPSWPLITMDGGAGCSLGNQSGGLFRSSICERRYVLVLPGTLLTVVGGSAGNAPFVAANAHEMSAPAGERAGAAAAAAGAGACCAATPSIAVAISIRARIVLFIDNLLMKSRQTVHTHLSYVSC